jgi:hypothetical protein
MFVVVHILVEKGFLLGPDFYFVGLYPGVDCGEPGILISTVWSFVSHPKEVNF